MIATPVPHSSPAATTPTVLIGHRMPRRATTDGAMCVVVIRVSAREAHTGVQDAPDVVNNLPVGSYDVKIKPVRVLSFEVS